MAIQFPNFLGVPVQKPDFSGIGDAIANYYGGKMMPKQDLIEAVKAQFAKPNAEADLQHQQLMNAYQALVNKYTPEDYESQFAARKALADNRNMGLGGRAGVTAQQQRLLQQEIKRDNPNFTDDQAFDAAGNLVQGNNTLSDGTPFNVSGLTQLSAAKAVMQGSTAGLTTQGVKASQAEAEIPVADRYITMGRTPYGDTIAGVSPQYVADMASPKNVNAQRRLGEYAAANLLQLEKSALGLKMAGIESGVTIMDEAMSKANQTIKQMNFIQTDKARQVALDTYRQALTEMLKARKGVGVLQSGLTGDPIAANKSKPSSGRRLRYNPDTGVFQ